MTPNSMDPQGAGKRSEPRDIVDRFYSVEFSVKGLEPIYQFKIWNISTRGVCILVREDSALIEHVSVGDILKMKYYPNELLNPAEFLSTQVKHITRDDQGRFRGHFMVGLEILDNA